MLVGLMLYIKSKGIKLITILKNVRCLNSFLFFWIFNPQPPSYVKIVVFWPFKLMNQI